MFGWEIIIIDFLNIYHGSLFINEYTQEKLNPTTHEYVDSEHVYINLCYRITTTT